jgi:hypothetical protein
VAERPGYDFRCSLYHARLAELLKEKTMRIVAAAFGAWTVALATFVQGQEVPKPAAPEKEHQWLSQMKGEWETDAEAMLEPGKPPMKCQGTASGRMVGGLWIVIESKMAVSDPPMTGIMTLGYDPAQKKFLGTWIDSMTAHLWKYEGSLDEAGKVLTLEAEGPNPMSPGKLMKYRDAIEDHGPDHKVLTSSMQMPDGKWVQFMTMNYRRMAKP